MFRPLHVNTQVTGRSGETPQWNRNMLVGYNLSKVHVEGVVKVSRSMCPHVEIL